MIAALFFNQFANQWKANWQFKPASSSLSGIKWGPVPPRFIWPRFGLVQRAAVAFDAAHKKCPNKVRPSQLIRAIWTRFSPRQFRFWLLPPFDPFRFGLSPLFLREMVGIPETSRERKVRTPRIVV